MLKSILSAAAVIAIVLVGGFGTYAWHGSLPVMTPSERPHFDAATVEKGRLLAAAGYCAACHTAPGGAPYAGNYPMVTSFGTIYASNITPDPQTGIGDWSPEAFRRALHEGVDRDGRNLFPAFPYDHFTKMSDADVDAIYAYIMSDIPPVNEATKQPSIPFPLNIRYLQSGWKLLFVHLGRYQPDPSHSDAWNRGAYLVEGVSHCGACHTPRNGLGAEERSQQYAGAVIDNWTAPPLTKANPSSVPWSTADFVVYLKTGSDPYHGVASGPMAEVVAGLRQLPDSDIEAIGTYLGSVSGATASNPAQIPDVVASIEAGKPDPAYRDNLGERLYASACASCHYNPSADSLKPERPDLGIISATRLDDPSNLIHTILDGVPAAQGVHGVAMPAFRTALDDSQIAAIAAYVRATQAGLPPWLNLEATVQSLRAHAGTN
ncbi:MAG TPA: cytochrome c [Acidocella sp.]|nr:cytochrome c [Acidocella sp.]